VTDDDPTIEVGTALRQTADPTLTGYQDVRDVYEEELVGRKQEDLVAVFLSTSNHVLKDALMFRGSLRSIDIKPRDIVREALDCNAAAVILLHNHPDGDAEATQADIETTKTIQERLEMFDISLLDHVIISKHGCYSMTQNGDI
jgi:DNA repair protein RadC